MDDHGGESHSTEFEGDSDLGSSQGEVGLKGNVPSQTHQRYKQEYSLMIGIDNWQYSTHMQSGNSRRFEESFSWDRTIQ